MTAAQGIATGAAPDAVRLTDLGVRFGRTWALRGVSAVVPAGAVVAVVGTNGAGKTSLLRVVAGLQPVTEGSSELFGARFRTDDPQDLARIGYVGQRKPLYGYLTVGEMLRYGRAANPRWDHRFAVDRVRAVGVDPRRRVDDLSGGQRTQVAVTMALAKRPDLLVLDEPLSELDPLAREQVTADLMAEVADRGVTVLLSSHILGELESTCDQVIALHDSQVVLAGDIESIVGEHVLLTGPADGLLQLSRQGDIVDQRRHGSSARALVRLSVDARFLDPRWQVHRVGMDAVVVAYLRARESPQPASGVFVAS